MVRGALRGLLAGMTRRTPRVRGLGRLVLAADRWLTDGGSPASYLAEAEVNDGSRLLLDLRGLEQKFAFYYGGWEEELIAAVKQLFRGGVFYDVGASVGLYAVTFGRICTRHGGFVRAFEPVPANRERLQKQLALNGLGDDVVRLEVCALGDKPGVVSLTLVDSGRPGNAKITGAGGIEAPIVTLDSLWRDRGREPIDFLKIDTEGWDARILDGGREALAAARPNLLVEFNRERMTNLGIPLTPSWEFLTRELGLRAFAVERLGWRPLTEPGAVENILFVRPEAAPKT